MPEYAHPDALVDTAWLAEHAKDPRACVFEVEVDTMSYDEGPGRQGRAVGHCGGPGRPQTIAYCRIGERSAHTWLVLRYLLGHEKVRNYDGSWTEWGSLIGVPIEKG